MKSIINATVICNPKLVDSNTITGIIGVQQEVTIRRKLHGFEVRLQVAVGKVVLHDDTTTAADREAWYELERRALASECRSNEIVRKTALDLATAAGLFNLNS